MRPYIICHMLSSVDGKIDGASFNGLTPAGEYEVTAAELNGDAWICGRTTMQQHFADPEPFVPSSHSPAGPQPVHVARRAKFYAIAVDTMESFDGRAVISKAITSSASLASEFRRNTSPCSEKWGSRTLVQAKARLTLCRQ